MSRKNDVEELRREVKEQYEYIRNSYEEALRDESIDLRAKVKNLLENLRSSLDYMAHDIYEVCCQTARLSSGKQDPRDIYFPYGLNENDFKAGVGSKLPDLKVHSPEIYNLVESIQPFKCGDTWLYDLCSIIGKKKHDRLTRQVRQERESHTVRSEHGSVTIPINDPRVKITSRPGALEIFGVPAQISEDGIRTAPSDSIKHERNKWVAFEFEGTDVNVVGLLDKAVSNISKFSDDLYSLI